MISVQNKPHTPQRQAFGNKMGKEYIFRDGTTGKDRVKDLKTRTEKQNAQVYMDTAKELTLPTLFVAIGSVATAAALWTATALASPSLSKAKPATNQVVDTLRHVK